MKRVPSGRPLIDAADVTSSFTMVEIDARPMRDHEVTRPHFLDWRLLEEPTMPVAIAELRASTRPPRKVKPIKPALPTPRRKPPRPPTPVKRTAEVTQIIKHRRPFVREMPTVAPRSYPQAWLIGGFVLALALIGTVLAFGLRQLAAKPLGPVVAGGDVVVTVAGPEGTGVPNAAVYADGKRLCDSAPCTLSKLEPGTHFVQVSAPGFVTVAPRAVVVKSGETDSLALSLGRSVEPEPEPEASRVTEPASQVNVAPVGTATLNLKSTRVATVVVDGWELGETPRIGIQVSAGKHSIHYVHHRFGRREHEVNLEPGTTKTVTARF